MQFKLVVVAALAAAVSAQDSVPEGVKLSVLNVLVTALPASVLQAAATNQPAFISEIAKSVSAGQTPDWYKPLPTDVKSLLTKIYPVAALASTSASVSTTTAAPRTSTVSTTSTASIASTTSTASTASVVSVASVASVASTGALSSSGLNSTTITSINTPTLSSTSRVTVSGQPSSTSSAPSNAAAFPTAAIGSSIAGAMGVLGMLFL